MTSAGQNDSYINQILGGRYRIIEKIGSGGMGSVYLAEHTVLKKKIAVKILHLEQSKKTDALERFRREAVAASNIGQDNIVDVTDFGFTETGNAYFVMEYIDGISLAEMIKKEAPLPVYFVIAVASQICMALFSAHSKGIIHRDLKPENIIITKKENIYPFVKILDFGISKFVKNENEDEKPLTKAGAIFGTPEYMSPEQASGKEVTIHSDIYSLGILIYEMLTGKLPFTDSNFMKVLHKHQYEIPPFPSAINPLVPSDMDMVVLKCLEKIPENRFESMFELFSILKKVYKSNNLDKYINLGVIFDSTVVKRTTQQYESGDFSNIDIMKILNKSESEINELSVKKEIDTHKKNNFLIYLLLGISIFSLSVAAYFIFFYKSKPIIKEEIRFVEKPVESENKEEKPDNDSEKKEVKETKKKNSQMPSKKRKNVLTDEDDFVTIFFNSTLEGVAVYEKDSGKYICTTPCKAEFKKDEAGVMILGFKKKGYKIDSMIVRLDRDTKVNVELNANKQGD